MAIQVTISSITGESPYDIYICQTGGTSCFYMTTISSVPYIFDIPSPYNTSDAYMLKIIDNNGCTITGIEPVTTCSNVTPTITPTNTQTPTNTPTQTSTPTVTPTPNSVCSCSTYSIEFTANCGEAINWTECNTSVMMSEGPFYFSQYAGLGYFNTGSVLYICSCSVPTTICPSNITLVSVGCNLPTPTPTITPTTTLTSTPGLSPSPTSTQTSTPTNTPTVTPTTTITSTPTETPTNTPTPTETPAPPITYVGYLADEYTCGYDPLDGSATGCTLTSSSVDVRFPTSISPIPSRYYAPNPGGCSGVVYFIVGNSPSNLGPIIAGVTPHNVCINACQEECPL